MLRPVKNREVKEIGAVKCGGTKEDRAENTEVQRSTDQSTYRGPKECFQ